MTDLTIGPFSFPASLLVTFGAIIAGLTVGNLLAGTARARVERLLWGVLAAALLAARVAFVVRYWSFYSQTPLQVLDIRDGGFTPAAGVTAGLILGGWLASRNRGEYKALIAGVLTASLAWAAGLALVAPSGAGPALPEVTLARLEGGELALASLAGRPVVLNLWASWCPPCRREMPVLGKAQRENPDVTFVFANQGESADIVRGYLQAQGLALDNVMLDAAGRLAQQTGSPGLPTTLFFDAQGKLVDRRLGGLSAATLAERLEALRAPAGNARHPKPQAEIRL
ncbi:TlpA family protein disulfide reductase [Massilia horti]|uniref:TlpA family protein disulfide reductase n=1 Tax=Massilia horti TaxID=2562153 RepID=A0A4Y9T3K4_9BURK|nr:TlpA disulfide reductase family protein [Massilia horti]TFW32235.1 TlpA family protein disulfide reductase [Massilia horti]